MTVDIEGNQRLSSSRLPGFYRLSVPERRKHIARLRQLRKDAWTALDSGGIDLSVADGMIENAVGRFALPVGIAANFLVNGRELLIPMVIEEPSVIAAASNAARMVRAGGGFQVNVSDPVMIAQVQICDVPDPEAAVAAIEDRTRALIAQARDLTPGMVARGGGTVGIESRIISRPEDPDGGMVVVHLLVDCRDCMGANLVNTIAEGMAPDLARLASGVPGLRILSNLSTHRMVEVHARVPHKALHPDNGTGVAHAIAAASRFAELDPYRAATHNKGIMNGVDAVMLATANDWRGVEAGAHAYASMSGRYKPLGTWRLEEGALAGHLKMPLAVGTVGGAVSTHLGARLALEILGATRANELAAATGAAGLASNLAALRALGTTGIQAGHMPLHARKAELAGDSEAPRRVD